MIIAFLFYQILRSFITLLTLPIHFRTIIALILFETIAVISIGLMQNDLNRNQLTKKELEFQSRHDGMTNLYNLRHFRKKVDQLIDQKNPFCIGMFDVDHFKTYNDTHGHPAGDEVLKVIGQLLSKSVRKGDIFARYGGEEFIICISGKTEMQSVKAIAEEFRHKVETYPFYGAHTQPAGKVTISIGLSSSSSEKTLDELINEADQALYKAKKAGRNLIAIHE